MKGLRLKINSHWRLKKCDVRTEKTGVRKLRCRLRDNVWNACFRMYRHIIGIGPIYIYKYTHVYMFNKRFFFLFFSFLLFNYSASSAYEVTTRYCFYLYYPHNTTHSLSFSDCALSFSLTMIYQFTVIYSSIYRLDISSWTLCFSRNFF